MYLIRRSQFAIPGRDGIEKNITFSASDEVGTALVFQEAIRCKHHSDDHRSNESVLSARNIIQMIVDQTNLYSVQETSFR